jgi:hypothetical protein
MRKPSRVVVLASALALASAGCGSSTPTEPPAPVALQLGFDDVVMVPWNAPIPADYAGLSWENFFVVDSRHSSLTNTGYRLGAVSPPNAAFNGSSNPATIQSTGSLDVEQAYFTSAYAQTDEPYQVRIEAYRGGALKYTRLVGVVTTGPTLAPLNLLDVDKIVFTSLVNPADGRRSQFVMDDLKLTIRRP